MNDEIVVFFDGYCVLCNRSVQWLLKRDRHKKLKFSSLQGSFAQELNIRPPDNNLPDTLILYENGIITQRSEAILRITKHLGFPWNLALIFRMIPLTWRNRLYDYIALNRYRWFGKHESCLLPDPAWKDRFID